jgi:hypothetical protein
MPCSQEPFTHPYAEPDQANQYHSIQPPQDPEYIYRPPLWSSGQSSWPLTQRTWVQFPALPNFLHSNGSGTGFTQPREDK